MLRKGKLDTVLEKRLTELGVTSNLSFVQNINRRFECNGVFVWPRHAVVIKRATGADVEFTS